MLSFAAALLLAQAQPPLTPPTPPSEPPQHEPQIIETAPPALAPAPPAVPPKRPHGDGRTEREVGLTALLAGYLMGSLIVIGPPLFTKNGREPVQNPGEKRLGLIPVAGPMLWWFRARARLDARSWSFDGSFHYIPGLPYAAVATGAQAIGAGLLIYGIVTSNAVRSTVIGGEEVASSAAPPVAKLYVAPTLGGLSLQGAF